MIKQEIKEIFAKHFLDMGDDKVEEALAATLCEAGKAVLRSLPNIGQINPSHLAIAELTIETKSGLCVEMEVNTEQGTVFVIGGSREAFLEVYSKFYSIIQFLNKNLENLKFGPRLSKETFRRNIRQLTVTVSSRYEQIRSDNGGVANQGELDSISFMINMTLQLILGEEVFGEFNKCMGHIRSVIDEINSELVVKRSRKKSDKSSIN